MRVTANTLECSIQPGPVRSRLETAERISEQFLIPVLEAMLHQYPFVIKGFHCDNGSEFINKNVVNLLNKLLVGEFTKSRAYRTTDNALVEGKNGAVLRKHIGYGFIAAEHAASLQRSSRHSSTRT